jgi:hypothetical protein
LSSKRSCLLPIERKFFVSPKYINTTRQESQIYRGFRSKRKYCGKIFFTNQITKLLSISLFKLAGMKQMGLGLNHNFHSGWCSNAAWLICFVSLEVHSKFRLFYKLFNQFLSSVWRTSSHGNPFRIISHTLFFQIFPYFFCGIFLICNTTVRISGISHLAVGVIHKIQLHRLWIE